MFLRNRYAEGTGLKRTTEEVILSREERAKLEVMVRRTQDGSTHGVARRHRAGLRAGLDEHGGGQALGRHVGHGAQVAGTLSGRTV